MIAAIVLVLAQLFTPPPPFVPTKAVVTYTGPGDIVSGALQWGSCQFAYSAAVAAAGTQATCNLYRAADAHTCDIIIATTGSWGVTANCSTGGDNGTAVATWCNATTCQATEVYDQSGSNGCSGAPCNLIQATVGNQMTIAFNAPSSGLATIVGTSISQHYLKNTTIDFGGGAYPASFSLMAKYTSIPGQAALFAGSSGHPQIGFGIVANSLYIFAGTVVEITAADGSYHDIQAVFNTTNSAANVDGTDSTSLSPGSTLDTQAFMGVSGSTLAVPFNGNVGEIGSWSSAFSSTQRANLCHNQSTRWGVASC